MRVVLIALFLVVNGSWKHNSSILLQSVTTFFNINIKLSCLIYFKKKCNNRNQPDPQVQCQCPRARLSRPRASTIDTFSLERVCKEQRRHA